MNKGLLYAIGGVTVAGLLAAFFAKGAEDAVETRSLEELRAEFLSHFNVETGCIRVTYIGDAEQAPNFWATTGGPLLDSLIALLAPTATDPSEITTAVLTYIFPNCPWPPPVMRLDLKALYAAILFAVGQRSQ